MPGHGTVPAGLTTTRWEAWLAATRSRGAHGARDGGRQGALAPGRIFERRRAGAEICARLAFRSETGAARPAGAALAHGRHHELSRVSPACSAGRAAFPSFAKAAWLDVLPEYNPSKYNSFPVNAARQSSQVVRAVQEEFARAAKSGALAKLPPVLTFQSVLDATVSDAAPWSIRCTGTCLANGSELVLFDVNRRRRRRGRSSVPEQANALATLLPPAPRQFAVTVVGNAAEDAVDG